MDILTLISRIEGRDLRNYAVLSDYFEACKLAYAEHKEVVAPKIMEICNYCDTGIASTVGRDNAAAGKFYDLKKMACKQLAKDYFEYFLFYIEWDRPPRKKFYPPRRKVLKVIVDALQELEEKKIKFLGISLPTRVGKSTLCVFFMTWHMGRHPDTANVASGHSDKLTDSFFRELLSIMTDADTYHWAEIFPESPVVNTSAKNESIDLVREKRFPTITCRSVGGTLTGAVEIGEDGILYCDDLVEDLEESLNPDRLQAKYDAYLNQLKDRKKDGAVELMVGTRWNVLDPLGRIHDMYVDDPAYRFIVIPALNEKDESNFDYNYGVGFSTAYYHDMRANIDRATWWAKYMGSPYVREGLLFPAEELQYYNGVLPDGEPDRIVAACDVAWGGGDYLSMPVCYCYGDAWYIHDVVFSNLDKTVTQPLVEGKLSQHLPHSAVFEANNGGHEYCSTIDTRLREKNVRLNLTSRPAPTKTSKIARIVKVAPEIRKMFFIQPKYASQEYRAFLNQVCTFVITGKNEHDDAPDSLAMLVDAISSNFGVVTVMERPF